MKREVTPLDLAGTLYTPAIHRDLSSTANGIKFENLKSLVICLEDSILDTEVSLAKEKLKQFLTDFKPTDLKVFVRIRSFSNFYDILEIENIEKIDGFVIPKFDTFNMKDYLSIITSKNLHKKFHFMFSLETNDVFDLEKLKAIRNMLQQLKRDVLSIRIGLEDLSKRLSLRRNCGKTIYEIPIFNQIVMNIILTFKPFGFNISAPVYSCFNKESNETTFTEEIIKDLENGLFGKTIIHPTQIEIVNQAYRVSEKDYQLALEIINSVKGVVGFKGQMLEKATNLMWAESIIKKAKIFGVNSN
jgi:citrate lyase beta subunit